MNIPSAALVANDYWVLRFTPYGIEDPFLEQISSSGFYISGPLQPSTIINTVTAQPSTGRSPYNLRYCLNLMASAVTASFTAESSSATAIGITSSRVPPLLPTQSVLSNPDTASTGKGWIAGAVVGSIVGVALGGVLVWMLLRKQRRSRDLHADKTHAGYGNYPTKPLDRDGGGKGHAYNSTTTSINAAVGNGWRVATSTSIPRPVSSGSCSKYARTQCCGTLAWEL